MLLDTNIKISYHSVKFQLMLAGFVIMCRKAWRQLADGRECPAGTAWFPPAIILAIVLGVKYSLAWANK